MVFLNIDQQKHQQKPAEQKPRLLYAVSQAQSYTKSRSYHSIIRPQASVD